jgi:hypothetical protein
MLLQAIKRARAVTTRGLTRQAGAVYRWPKTKVVALDLECTGINTYRDRILQYGVYGVDSNGQTINVSAMVDAEVPTGRDPYRNPGRVEPRGRRADADPGRAPRRVAEDLRRRGRAHPQPKL